MVLLVSFDLTDSRGLSWSIHNGPDLSTLFCCSNRDTNHQHPFMAILNWASFSHLHCFFSTSNKGALPSSLSHTLPLCPNAWSSIDFFTVILLKKWHPCLPVRLRCDLKGRCSKTVMTVAVIPRVWPHQLHTGLYRLNWVTAWRKRGRVDVDLEGDRIISNGFCR